MEMGSAWGTQGSGGEASQAGPPLLDVTLAPAWLAPLFYPRATPATRASPGELASRDQRC